MISDVITQEIYFFYVYSKPVTPTCIQAWSTRLDISLSENEWEYIFSIPKLFVKDLHIREFQHKIVHRFYACNSTVAKWDNNVSANCALCDDCKANILHTFYSCKHVLSFWRELEHWFREHSLTVQPSQLTAQLKFSDF